MPLENAVETVERLALGQHRDWRPDQVIITDRYILYDFGVELESSARIFASQSIGLASGSTKKNWRREQVFFKSVDEVVLYSWTRKFAQWYVVSLAGSQEMYALRTRSLADAREMQTALQTLVDEFGDK